MHPTITKFPTYARQLMLFAAIFCISYAARAFGDDVSLKAILSPTNMSCGNATTPVRVVIGNPGSNSQSSVPVTVIISGSSSATLNDTLKTVLTSGGMDTFTFATTLNTSTGGTYTIKAYTDLTNDSDRTNDTNTVTVTIHGTLSSPLVSSTSSCGSGKVTFTAIPATGGAANYYYANATTDTILAASDTFTTPVLSASKTYYVASAYTNTYSAGIKDNTVGTGAVILNNTLGLTFNALSDFTLDSMTVYPNASGDVVVRLLDSATGKVLDSVVRTVSVSASNTAVRIAIGFKIHKGKGYALDAVGSTVTGLFRTGTGTSYPYTVPGIVSITGPYNVVNTRYYYFYDWRVSAFACPSSRVAVTATITPVPAAPTVTSTSACGSGKVLLTASAATGGAANYFYANATTDSILAASDTFTTPFLTSPLTYYVSSALSTSAYVGVKDNNVGTGAVILNNTLGLTFDALSGFTLDSVTVYPNNSGTVQVRLLDSVTHKAIDSVSRTVKVSASNTPVRIAIGFRIPKGKHYALDAMGSTVTGLFRTGTGTSYPYTVPGVVSIVAPYNVSNTRYYYFYDWKVTSLSCASSRTAVTANIITIPTAPKVTSTSSCGSGSVKLIASGTTAGAANYFYANATTDTVLAASDTFTTPVLSAKTTYYVASAYTNTYSVGVKDNNVGTGAVILNNTLGLTFNALSDFTLDSVTVYPNNSGTVQVRLLDSVTHKAIDSVATKVTVKASNTPVRIAIGFKIAKGKHYALDAMGSTVTGLFRTGTGTYYPYTIPGVVSIVNPYNVSNTRYYYFYDWKVSALGCASSRTAITANIIPVPTAPAVTSTSTCGTGSVTLKASAASAGASNYFYANATTDTILAAADSFVTPVLSAKTTYYVAAALSNSYYVGVKDNKVGTGAVILNNALGLTFNALSNFTLDSVTVYPDNSGKVVVRLLDSTTHKVIDSVIRSVKVKVTNTPVRIAIGFRIAKGNHYALDAMGSTVTGLFRTGTGTYYPYTIPGVVSIVNPYNVSNTRYYYFYDWKVTALGCASSRTAVTANIGGSPKPTARFSATKACLGSSTSFTDSSSVTSGGTLTSWSLDFGDGSTPFSSTSTGSTTHTYTTAGTYKAVLTVLAGSCSDTISRSVTVSTNPKAGFSSAGTCSGNATSFTNSSTGATAYFYSFGDKGTDTARNPVHTYAAAGSYNVILAVSNGSCIDTMKSTLTINASPVAGFTSSGTCSGTATSFTDNSKPVAGYISSRSVDYGDLSATDTALHAHTYANAGTYHVTLKITNNGGCSTTFTDSVMITPTPKTGFTFTLACHKASFVATDSATAGNVFNWSFGSSGATATGQKVTYTYANDSTYTVTLSAANGSCTGKHDSLITVVCTDIRGIAASAAFGLNIYPNPFKDATNISYSLDEKASVKIEVYDLTGRSLATLLDHKQEAGEYTLKFTPRDFMANSAGVYIIKMTVGDKTITRQVMTLK